MGPSHLQGKYSVCVYVFFSWIDKMTWARPFQCQRYLFCRGWNGWCCCCHHSNVEVDVADDDDDDDDNNDTRFGRHQQ
jgi:hypothetical protein